jgi:hypothetical protein
VRLQPKEVLRTGDALAVVRDIAPPEILQAVIPVAEPGDHVLRMPASRSLATSALGTSPVWRTVAANFRRMLGLEPRARPQLRVLGAPGA